MTRICVYDIAADSGGALTVLEEYYARAVADSANEYLFVVSTPNFEEKSNVRVVRFPEVKRSWAARVRFETLTAHQIIEEYNPDHVLSLQNTVVPLTNRKQVVYMHNPLPNGLCDLSFSMINDSVLWVRQNIIGRLILYSVRKADGVIVQTEWIKRRLTENCGVDDSKIAIEPPVFEPKLPLAKRTRKDNLVSFFYPASAASFKNHEVLVEACKILASEGVFEYRVIFTVDGSESKRMGLLRKHSEEFGLPIDFHGWISPAEMGKWYANSDCLIFPSKLETWGLPLKEAQIHALSILASDLEYAHETVGSYQKVTYFDPNDALALSKIMKSQI